ncbi:MAG: hypothetical protein KF793_05370 [Nitrospira sp.]|nr:hypothetical protein [Nitrospira sp.]
MLKSKLFPDSVYLLPGDIQMPFTCIYCSCSESEQRPSDAHIFPYALGGVLSTTETVCLKCNQHINQYVENPILRSFAFFRSVWGIRGRFRDVVRVRAKLSFAGMTKDVWLDEHGEIDSVIIHKTEDEGGKISYSLFGPPEKVEAKKLEMSTQNPSIRWIDRDLHGIAPPESVAEFSIDLGGLPLRRLASKVAFERFAQLRFPVLSADFNEIRRFILHGDTDGKCCGILIDERLLFGSFNFQPPSHAVVLIAHPKDTVLGAVVSFFGLFYYWVVLSKNYRALAALDDLLIEDPQKRESDRPLLRGQTGKVRLSWPQVMEAYCNNPADTVTAASRYATRKFKEAINTGT